MKKVRIVKGFKGTDCNMACRGHKFELGKWYTVKGKLGLCENGFHFCKYPSGVYSYYRGNGTRVFEVEAQGVLNVTAEPGTDAKYVCRKIRLVKEITPGLETSNLNIGSNNTGDYNTGHRNTGDNNTGHRNTGDNNTGTNNVGNYNTGIGNAGHRNTGDYNVCDSSTGMFNIMHQTIKCFDVDTGLTLKEFLTKYPEYTELGAIFESGTAIDNGIFNRFKHMPGVKSRSQLDRFAHIYRLKKSQA